MQVEIDRLRRHIVQIAATPRPAESPQLRDARDYVCAQLETCGWTVLPQPFQARTEDGMRVHGVNLVARHARHAVPAGPRFCLGAHLDSRPDTPGADDNASAIASLLEIARVLPDTWPGRAELDFELVAFDLEECGMLGGAEHASRAKSAGIDLRGMVSLEMLGYCDHAPGSQALPRSLEGLYPDTGNFIAVIGNQNSNALMERFAGGMKRVAGLAVESLIVPENGLYLQATRLSDHSPFWDAGYAALMVTDTSFLRNPHYHQPTDTLDTLDMDFLALVAEGCLEGVRSVLGHGV